ncbi:hypothetical protein ACTMU2_13380 [Cupriavidus basilensis]
MLLNLLLLFVPIAIALEFFAASQHLLIFIVSAVAILPLAQKMGHATRDNWRNIWEKALADFLMRHLETQPS